MTRLAGSLDSLSTRIPWVSPCRRCAILALIGLLASLGAAPARAGSSWALPLVGGALGGYALHSLMQSRSAPAPAPASHPAPHPVAPPAQPASAQARLQQLDQLAAKGLITPAEYKQRRQAIINTL